MRCACGQLNSSVSVVVVRYTGEGLGVASDSSSEDDDEDGDLGVKGEPADMLVTHGVGFSREAPLALDCAG